MSYHLIPKFVTKDETFAYVIANEKKISQQKKAQIKFADPVAYNPMYVLEGGEIVTHKTLMATKADKGLDSGLPIKVKVIINTTNLLDSHGDVHIPKLWNKSISDKGGIFDHCKEHHFSFDGTICDEAKAITKNYNWSEIGANYTGQTQALVFESIIEPTDKTRMYDLYLKGKVKNHSVGMRYIKYVVCINTNMEGNETYLENWNKYRPMVANGDKADDEGYFWAILEAEIVEGSAVKAGSNWVTPTLSVENVNNNSNENKENTFVEPVNTTPQNAEKKYSFDDLLQAIKN